MPIAGPSAGAFDELTCVTGTNGFSGFGSADADLSLAAGFWSAAALPFSGLAVVGCGFSAADFLAATGVGFTAIGSAFRGGGAGGRLAGSAGRGGADDGSFSLARAGPTMSQTMGYRTVLNPIENATNANPNIVAADLGISFPYAPFQHGST